VPKHHGHEDFLFVRPWTGYRVSRQRANRRIRLLAAHTGVDAELVKTLTPRGIRHRFAKNLLEAGENPRAVMDALGYAHISTAATYLRDDEAARLEVLRRAARRDRNVEPLSPG